MLLSREVLAWPGLASESFPATTAVLPVLARVGVLPGWSRRRCGSTPLCHRSSCTASPCSAARALAPTLSLPPSCAETPPTRARTGDRAVREPLRDLPRVCPWWRSLLRDRTALPPSTSRSLPPSATVCRTARRPCPCDATTSILRLFHAGVSKSVLENVTKVLGQMLLQIRPVSRFSVADRTTERGWNVNLTKISGSITTKPTTNWWQQVTMSGVSVSVDRTTSWALICDYQSGHCLHLSVVSQHVRRQGLERPEAPRWDLHRQWLKAQYRDTHGRKVCCPHPSLLTHHFSEPWWDAWERSLLQTLKFRNPI